MIMRNASHATAWAAAGALMGVGAALTFNSNVMFALMFAGLAVAFLLVAASCLLMDPKPDPDDRDGDQPGSTGRRRWGPR